MSKWNPFNAVAPGSSMINEVLKEKNKVTMPTLSDDQINELQEKILTAFNNQSIIKIKYFRNGRYYINDGIITNIDVSAHKLVLNGDFPVFFSQIIEICEKNTCIP